ncbi:MAG: LuxR C-terminal-related transcriptional regulator [Pseudomonadales bacterium]|nr:LuxR C-terminal-related transcriptional regulator [Pseudomonadales bacterium]
MQQSSAEVELGKLAELCGSLRLHDREDRIADRLLDPIAAVIGAESAAFRHLDLRQSRPRILNLISIGVENSVSDDYLAHFHRFDPFLERLAAPGDRSDSIAAFPLTDNSFQSYYRDFLQPNGLVHHAGFMLRDRPGHQAWIFNFHRRGASPDFAALELARARLIAACLRGQASRSARDDDTLAGFNIPILPQLSPRERDICIAVAKGLANKQVAASLGISARTVENHLRNIYDKLHINTRTQLVFLLYKPDYNVHVDAGE